MRFANAAYERIGPLARRWLPAPLKRRLGGLVGSVESAFAHARSAQAEAAAPALSHVKGLLAPEAFADGPIVLVNNALAWGGAERQIVNTLTGLDARQTPPIGLLCLKLGEGADYEFYRSALADFRGWIRNMKDLASARAVLEAAFAKHDLDPAEAVFAWLPSDVRERIVRLLADFIELRPRVVHAWQDALSIEAAYAAKLAGVPRIIVSARNMAPIHFAYHRPYMASAYRQLAASTDIVMLNNSESGARDYAKWLDLPATRFTILRNGIDVAPRSERESLRKTLAIPPDAPIVGSIFRFYEEKRPLLWIEAAGKVAAALPRAHFVIFGVGPLLKAARARAERLGFADRLHTPGAAPDAASALAGIDVFVLTSQFEGTPNVVLEASLQGAPVIATDAGGTAEAILSGASGYVVEASADAIAERVLSVLNDHRFRESCKTDGPDFVRTRFGLARMVDETLALYGFADPP